MKNTETFKPREIMLYYDTKKIPKMRLQKGDS